MPSPETPALYGISEVNSSRHGEDLWGKNQFNSAFPLALCLYMRDEGISPVSVRVVNGKIGAVNGWAMADVIGGAADNPYYFFSTAFKPYSQFFRNNESDGIDLIVSAGGQHIRPLEVKLTVVPDSTTAKKSQEEWAPELVMRPVSSAYAMMGVASTLLEPQNNKQKTKAVRSLSRVYGRISDWGNESELTQQADSINGALNAVIKITEELQKPFLVQPIWRTVGQSWELCEQCFDVFVWSDVSILKIPLLEYVNVQGGKVARCLRETARHVRGLCDILQTGNFNYSNTYKGMALGRQTDKAFAIPGNRNIHYLAHKRLAAPVLSSSVLDQIVLNNGEQELKPERRFDAAVKAHMGNGK